MAAVVGRPVVRAAGLVVWRQGASGTEVLTVHRPAWQDWVLPKGHIDEGELPPVTACREFTEESGYRGVAARPVAVMDYPVKNTTKRVHWWVGRLIGSSSRPPADPREIDAVVWRPVADALAVLTYADERQVLTKALALGSSRTLVIVRHAKAAPRETWTKADSLRPLSERGQRQAKKLRELLAAYGVGALMASPAARCKQTLRPYSQSRHVKIELRPELSDEAVRPSDLARLMRELRADLLADSVPRAICGHLPSLPAMAASLGWGEDIETVPMKTAEALVLHLDARTGSVQASERYRCLL
ncbi:MAG: NUDIX hydrolase [Propionibacteriaceae bacterium]|nr:NUDIX hydrolase [Propionibacteriaceae bacterium]